MKLAGMVFIVLSAGSVGVRIGLLLKRRCRYLRLMLHALGVLENEIAFGATPLPQAFLAVSNASEGEMKQIFLSMSKQMEQCCWISPKMAMEKALSGNEDPSNIVLTHLAEQLGKYDLQTQLNALQTAKTQAEQIKQELERERSIKSGTYETLSICAGLAAAILLM